MEVVGDGALGGEGLFTDDAAGEGGGGLTKVGGFGNKFGSVGISLGNFLWAGDWLGVEVIGSELFGESSLVWLNANDFSS